MDKLAQEISEAPVSDEADFTDYRFTTKNQVVSEIVKQLRSTLEKFIDSYLTSNDLKNFLIQEEEVDLKSVYDLLSGYMNDDERPSELSNSIADSIISKDAPDDVYRNSVNSIHDTIKYYLLPRVFQFYVEGTADSFDDEEQDERLSYLDIVFQ